MTEADQKLMDIIKAKLNFKLRRRMLVKPLDKTMVTIEMEVPVYLKDEDGNFITDENGIKTYDTTEKEKKEVPSNYRKGIVIKMPFDLTEKEIEMLGFGEGDIIMFMEGAAAPFDQVNGSVFLDPWSTVGIYE